MSIINDALKKVEKIRDGDPQESTQELKKDRAGERQSTQGKSKKVKEKITLIAVTGCGILLMLFAAVILLKGGSPLSYVPTTAKDTGMQSSAISPVPEELILTGIVYGEKMPMAIINGSVYIEGDIVKKAKIIKISEDKVTLDKKGRIVELVVR